MTTNTARDRMQSGNTAQPLIFTASMLLFAGGLLASTLHTNPGIAISMQWAALALFLPVALRRRSLLVWTFFAMIVGAELGVDAPRFAAQTHFLGDIFLRLIRMI